MIDEHPGGGGGSRGPEAWQGLVGRTALEGQIGSLVIIEIVSVCRICVMCCVLAKAQGSLTVVMSSAA